MPYIPESDRADIDPMLEPLLTAAAELTEGQINYIITKIIDAYVGSGSYFAFNNAVGVLECAKLELVRRRLGPYEDVKCKQRGDVYQANRDFLPLPAIELPGKEEAK